MPTSDATKRAQKAYNSKSRFFLSANVPKEDGQAIKDYAATAGLSVSSLIIAALREYIAAHPLPGNSDGK